MDKAPVSHARIVTSQDEGAREKIISELARAQVCEKADGAPCGVCRHCRLALKGIHPDIIFIDRPTDDKGRPKREIPVAAVRQMAADAWILPQEAERKVYVIREANRMNTQAQNAALKILEEPPAYAVFILGTLAPEELLPTIRSRCVLITAGGARESIDDTLADDYLSLVRKSDAAALCAFFTSCESLDAARVSDMLAGIRSGVCLALADGAEAERRRLARIPELLDRAEEYLRLNVSVKHVLGMLNVLTERGNHID